MTYYKAFNRDLTCRGFQYEEGKTYEIKDEPILCERGFHFCKSLVLTLEYYPAQKITDNKYAEVEALGDVKFEEPTKHKGVTNKLKIVRILTDDEVCELVDERSNSGNSNSGNSNSGGWNSGNSNSGDRNSGYRNSGDWNSGNSNSGDWNSGNSNSGGWNSGNSNSGYRNSGNSNSGNWNSGYRNSGGWNSGNSNSGGWNSGDWNSCDYETGVFNSEQSKIIRVFNKECDRREWEGAYKPAFLYFDIDPKLGYKGSFQKSWDEADKKDRIKVKELPNFNPGVFYEISGIDLREK